MRGVRSLQSEPLVLYALPVHGVLFRGTSRSRCIHALPAAASLHSSISYKALWHNEANEWQI